MTAIADKGYLGSLKIGDQHITIQKWSLNKDGSLKLKIIRSEFTFDKKRKKPIFSVTNSGSWLNEGTKIMLFRGSHPQQTAIVTESTKCYVNGIEKGFADPRETICVASEADDLDYVCVKLDDVNKWNWMMDDKWIEIKGWEGGYNPNKEGYLWKTLNDFKLRIIYKKGVRPSADVNADGCCERVDYGLVDDMYRRFFDYGTIGNGNNIGYTSQRVTVEREIRTIEELADYLEKYAQGLDKAKWVAGARKEIG